MNASVKSAVRVLQVLEYFDSIRRAANMTEIARGLGYPLSSTSMLLQSMMDHGYLEQDAQRAYLPTPRVTLLGSWVAPQLAPDSDILRMMEEIGEKTGQTIVLATASESLVRYIHVVPATKTLRMHIAPGTTRPLATSGFGRLFLSSRSDEEVRRIVFRHNRQTLDNASQLSFQAVHKDLQAIRSKGYAISLDKITEGVGVVATHLPELASTSLMAVGIGGPSRDIRAHSTEFIDLLKDGIKRYCGDL